MQSLELGQFPSTLDRNAMVSGPILGAPLAFTGSFSCNNGTEIVNGEMREKCKLQLLT